MAEIPEVVRFHFARLAPSPWNWYTKSDYHGCALRWSAPEGNVALYIVFRSNENLPTDCCEDLLNGHYDDVVERIEIFKPITQLVDDEIHEKNRYLVLARLDNDDLVWIKDVESFQFTGAKPGESWTYWSNPYGDMPRMKAPCRLEYETVRVGTFCALEWDYPTQYPDFVGFDLIVCDVPYSPHTGADSDIAAFREVLSGKRGMQYSLERFVNTVVDNESFVNRFGYYALLVKLPDGGRVQIPLRHVSVPYEKGHPFQFLKARSSWGEGRDKMMAAYARWKAQTSAAAAQIQTMQTVAEQAELTSETSRIDVEFFRHSPDLSLESFAKNPDMLGIQFTAKIADASFIVAIRAKRELDQQSSFGLLEEAVEKGVVNGDIADAYAYCPENGYMVLIDGDCHDKSNYAFAVYDPKDKQFAPLPHVKDVTVDYFMVNPSTSVLWGDSEFSFKNHLINCIQFEEVDKNSDVALEFRFINDTNIDVVELYVFDRPFDWTEERMRDFRELQATGKSKFGKKYAFEGKNDGVLDDVSPNGQHCYAAVSVDFAGNRTPVQIYSSGIRFHEEWMRVSDVARGNDVDLAGDAGSGTHVSETSCEEPIDAVGGDSGRGREFSSMSGVRESGSRRRYSWDEVESSPASASGESFVDDVSAEVSESDHEYPSRSGMRESCSRRRYSWDEVESSPASASGESVVDDVSAEVSESDHERSSIGGMRESGSRRRYSWNEEESSPASASGESFVDDVSAEVSESDRGRSSIGGMRESGSRRRYSWDEVESSVGIRRIVRRGRFGRSFRVRS